MVAVNILVHGVHFHNVALLMTHYSIIIAMQEELCFFIILETHHLHLSEFQKTLFCWYPYVAKL